MGQAALWLWLLLFVALIASLTHESLAFWDGIISADEAIFADLVEAPLIRESGTHSHVRRVACRVDSSNPARGQRWTAVFPDDDAGQSDVREIRIHQLVVPQALVKFDVKNPHGDQMREWADFAQKCVEATCWRCRPGRGSMQLLTKSETRALKRGGHASSSPDREAAGRLDNAVRKWLLGENSDVHINPPTFAPSPGSRLDSLASSGALRPFTTLGIGSRPSTSQQRRSWSSLLESVCALPHPQRLRNATFNVVVLREQIVPIEVNCHNEWWWNDDTHFNMKLCNDSRFGVVFPQRSYSGFRPQFIMFRRSLTRLKRGSRDAAFVAEMPVTDIIRFDSTLTDASWESSRDTEPLMWGSEPGSVASRPSDGEAVNQEWRQRISLANIQRFAQRHATACGTMMKNVRRNGDSGDTTDDAPIDAAVCAEHWPANDLTSHLLAKVAGGDHGAAHIELLLTGASGVLQSDECTCASSDDVASANLCATSLTELEASARNLYSTIENDPKSKTALGYLTKLLAGLRGVVEAVDDDAAQAGDRQPASKCARAHWFIMQERQRHERSLAADVRLRSAFVDKARLRRINDGEIPLPAGMITDDKRRLLELQLDVLAIFKEPLRPSRDLVRFVRQMRDRRRNIRSK